MTAGFPPFLHLPRFFRWFLRVAAAIFLLCRSSNNPPTRHPFLLLFLTIFLPITGSPLLLQTFLFVTAATKGEILPTISPVIANPQTTATNATRLASWTTAAWDAYILSHR